MTVSRSIHALRRANPRGGAERQASVDAVAARLDAEIAAQPVPERRAVSRRLVHLSLAGAVLAIAAVVAAVALPGGGTQSAAAAVEKAAATSASAAERSGIAAVSITHGGRAWAGSTIQWHDDDLSVASILPSRQGRPGGQLLVVDGTLYGIEPGYGWVALGSPLNIDPGSGTTPAEYLASAREDVGGTTLRRLTTAMSGLTSHPLGDGSTAYSGTVPAVQIARATGFKEGHSIRVLPFGLAAHDQAADSAAMLDSEVVVGKDGVVRKIAVSWGSWRYTVAYRELGTAPAIAAPENAKSLEDIRRVRR
jgi:hypothetical protein